MNQVITDKNILHQIALLLELNPQAFSARTLDYCGNSKHEKTGVCKETYSYEGIINHVRHEASPVFGFIYNDLKKAIDNAEEIKKIEAYQQLHVCKDHYEELLAKICTSQGWKTEVPDKWQEKDLEGIYDDSLVFAPHRAQTLRVFTVRNGLVTFPDGSYKDSLKFSLSLEPDAQKEFEQKISLDKKIINAFIEAYNLKNIYVGISGAVRPS